MFATSTILAVLHPEPRESMAKIVLIVVLTGHLRTFCVPQAKCVCRAEQMVRWHVTTAAVGGCKAAVDRWGIGMMMG